MRFDIFEAFHRDLGFGFGEDLGAIILQPADAESFLNLVSATLRML